MSRVDVAAADRALASAVECGDLPSAVATAAYSDDIVYEGAFGVREMGADTPMTIDSVLWIASMTKAITSAAAMQLVERGELSLDEPAGDVVEPLARVQVLDGFDGDGEPVLRPPKSPVTLRHLLTHTSGYGYDIWSQDLIRYQERKGLPSVTTCERSALDTPLLFDPGEEWLYGIGVDWAGLMIEEVSGRNLGEYFRDNIFEPLGMTSTGFEITDDMRARLASIHTRTETAQLEVFPFEITQQPEFQMGGGGLYSTVRDFLRFLRTILRGGELEGTRILEAATVEQMGGNQIGDVDVVTLHTAMPPYSNDANFFPGMQQKWGLGFLINSEATRQGRSAGSMAWAGLANSYYWIDVANDNCGVWSTQLMPFVDDAALGSFADFEAVIQQASAR